MIKTIKDKKGNSYQLDILPYEKFLTLYTETFTNYFRPRVNFEPEKFHGKLPSYSCFQLTQNNQVIGIFSGYESAFGMYKMHLSVIHPHFRRLGLYAAYLDSLTDFCKANGFTQIVSEHSNSNSPIIIAKLQNSFYITNLQITPFYGAEVQLTRFLDSDMENIFKFRCGDLTLTKETNERFREQIQGYTQYFKNLE